MRKLNNKGMTTVEILITFVIVISLVISMYASISSLKEKQTIESYKESMVTYKNLLTKEIQDDLIMEQVIDAYITPVDGDPNSSSGSSQSVTFTFKNGSRKTLTVNLRNGCEAVDSSEVSTLCSSKGINNSDQEAKYSIIYNNEEFPLPNLGSEKIDNFNSSGSHTIYSLKIDSVSMEVSDDNIFSLNIKFTHPDLSDKYQINIVSPINY